MIQTLLEAIMKKIFAIAMSQSSIRPGDDSDAAILSTDAEPGYYLGRNPVFALEMIQTIFSLAKGFGCRSNVAIQYSPWR